MMSVKLDLNLLPIHRQDGEAQSYLPGIHVATPPRRAARGRTNDHLVVYLHTEGDLRLKHEQQLKLLEGAAKTFFSTSGSITTALRAVVEALNEVILRRNSHGGQPITAYLNLCVLRDDKLYIVQSGASHSFLFSATGLDYFHHVDEAGRGLGMGHTPPIKYFQIDLTDKALYLIAPRVPGTWDEDTIKAAYGKPLSIAARQFFEDAQTDLKALLIEATTGSGMVKILPTNAGISQSTSPVSEPAKPQPVSQQPAPQATPPTPRPATPPIENAPPVAQTPSQFKQLRDRAAGALSAVGRNRKPASPPTPAETAAAHPDDLYLDDLTPDQRSAQQTTAPASDSFGKKFNAALLNTLRATGRLFSRLLPDEEALKIPDWIMAVIAILVPLIFGAIAFVVYTNVGRQQLYDTYYQQAFAASQVALAQGEGPETRATWEQVIVFVDKTELYGITPDTESLRIKAQSVLDELEGIQRIGFTPAIAGLLAPSIRIEEMVVVNDDLYLLDVVSGNVFRAWKTGTGDLEMDSTFQCGPGKYGSIIVGPLIDVVPLSKFNEMNATVVAMDNNGNLVYCAAGTAPTAVQLAPPDMLWGKPNAMALDGGDLYILDPLTNAVWVYTGEKEEFLEKPHFFFAAEVPPSLKSAIDMVVNEEDLYLLHEEGLLTHCIFSTLKAAPTTCEETTLDAAIGTEQITSVFTKFTRRPAPDPALFFLDQPNQSIYMFGVRLHFERQFHASDKLVEGNATAFAVSDTRTIFIAIGNKIFRSTIP